MKVIAAEIVRYKRLPHQAEAWEVKFETTSGVRMSRNTWNSNGAAQAYANAVLTGKRKPEFFYI